MSDREREREKIRRRYDADESNEPYTIHDRIKRDDDDEEDVPILKGRRHSSSDSGSSGQRSPQSKNTFSLFDRIRIHREREKERSRESLALIFVECGGYTSCKRSGVGP